MTTTTPPHLAELTVDGYWVSSTGAFSQTMIVPGGRVPVAAVTLGDRLRYCNDYF